jgi:hypothetical protein
MASQFDYIFDAAFDSITDVFGDEATVLFKSSKFIDTLKVKGLYAKETQFIEPGEGVRLTSPLATFEMREDESRAINIQDRLLIKNKLYEITEIERDAMKNIKLILQKPKRRKLEPPK